MPVDPKHPRRGAFKVPPKGANKSAEQANQARKDQAGQTPLKAIREAQKDLSPKEKLSDRQVRKKK